jgi:hypothetical protein
MYSNYDDVGGSPPSDFVFETSGGLSLGLGLAASVVILALCVGLWFFSHRRARQKTANLLLNETNEKGAALISKCLSRAVIVAPESQEATAHKMLDLVQSLFGKSLDLSQKLNKAVKDIELALEGKKEIDDTSQNGSGNLPAHITGGTVINIAVNNGVPSSGDTPANSHTDQALGELKPKKNNTTTPYARPVAIWIAVQALYDDWKTPELMANALKGAGHQLSNSALFKNPKEDILAKIKGQP